MTKSNGTTVISSNSVIPNRISNFQKNIDEAQSRLDLSQNELNLFTAQSEQGKVKLQQAEADIKTLGGTIAEKKKNLTDIKKEIIQNGN